MQCLEISDLIAYFNDTLKPGEKDKFENHLQSCQKCSKKLSVYKKFKSTLSKNIFYNPAAKSGECYDELQLTQYLFTKSKSKQRKEYHLHLNRCDSCLDKLVTLRTMLGELKTEGLILPDEKKWAGFKTVFETIKTKLTSFWDLFLIPRPVYRFAGLFVSVVVVGLVLQQTFRANKVPQTSRDSRIQSQIQLISPAHESLVSDSSSPEFEWSGNDQSYSYNFILLDSQGEIIWEEKTKDNKLKLPENIQLQSSMTYFWQVETFVDYGTSFMSDISRFTYIKK